MDLIHGRNIATRVFVQPTTHEARNFTTELNGLDSGFFLLGEVPIVWVWKEKKLDFELLRQGLQRVLNRVPIAAGRVRAGARAMEVTTVGSEGVLFEFQLAKTMPSEEDTADAWKTFGPPSPMIPLEPIAVPLIHATLTHFESGGCSLFVRFSHLLTDGSGMVSFMHLWSWETALATNSDDALSTALPSSSPSDVICGHQLRSGLDSSDLAQKDLDGRLTIAQTFKFMLSFVRISVTDEVADFEFTLDQFNELKRTVQSNLSKDQWVSSYEAFMALVLKSLAKADGKSNIDTAAVVNIRGRSKLFPQNYFGVGLSVHEIKGLNTTESVAKTAFALHESLRNGLEEMTAMEKLVLIPEKWQASNLGSLGSLLNGREGMLSRARYLTVWEKCISEDCTVINSWYGYPWLEINFGLLGGKESRPNFMRIPKEFRFRRHIHLAPKSESILQLRMQLPSSTMSKFRSAFRETGFKFREVGRDEFSLKEDDK
jgi:hypothetical protein